MRDLENLNPNKCALIKDYTIVSQIERTTNDPWLPPGVEPALPNIFHTIENTKH